LEGVYDDTIERTGEISFMFEEIRSEESIKSLLMVYIQTGKELSLMEEDL
jgi:hypothetical protein